MNPSDQPVVAVIDIGSNSIKLLVAARAAAGGLTVLATRTLEVRISAGLGQTVVTLSVESMARALAAIRTLLREAEAFSPTRCVLVATSAVRDARNGADFREQVCAATGHSIRLLTGQEEANLIGRGLACDPALAGLKDFYVFDLGGGSLECLAFRGREVQEAISLQLGCVRLTEQLVPDPAAPFSPATLQRIADHCAATFAASAFTFALPRNAVAVGTGGTVTTARAIVAAQRGATLEDTSPDLAVEVLRRQLQEIGGLPLDARRRVPGLSAARADVFPTALATLIAVAERGQFPAFRHSLYNLRFGLAREALESA